MYNVLRNVMHELHLVGALDSGKIQEAGTLSGLGNYNYDTKMPLIKLVGSLWDHNVRHLAYFTQFMHKY